MTSAAVLLLSLFLHNAFSSDVIDATANDFQQAVLDSKGPVFVKFYAPWCGHCKSLAPTWEKVATNLKGIVPIVKVDCTIQKDLCARYQVQGYPTIKLFKNKGKDVVDYQQARDARTIATFATSHIKSLVTVIKSEADLEKFLTKNPSTPHALLFSEKSTPNTLYQSLSMVYEGNVLLGQVSKDVKEVVDKYGPIDSFPHLVTIKGDTVEHSQGTISAATLAHHIKTLIGEKSEEPKEEAAPKKAPRPAHQPATKPSLVEVTQDNLETTCAKNLCVLGFVSGEAPEADQLSVLNAMTEKFYVDKKFVFGWVSCEKQKDLCQKLGITQPTFTVYNNKRHKIAKSSTFTEVDAVLTLERARGGDLTYSKVEL